MPFEGCGLLIPSGPSKHLFFILTQPCGNNKVALVNVSSVDPERYYDPTCVFEPGEHRFFQKRSYVFYEGARVMTVLSLQRGISSGDFSPHDPVSPSIFERICDGILEAEATPQLVARYVSAQFAHK